MPNKGMNTAELITDGHDDYARLFTFWKVNGRPGTFQRGPERYEVIIDNDTVTFRRLSGSIESSYGSTSL